MAETESKAESPEVPTLPAGAVVEQELESSSAVTEEAPQVAAVPLKKLNFSAGLIPGAGNQEGSDQGSWKPCGKADGVIYFDDIEGWDKKSNGIGTVKPGKERQALRYLAGPDTDFPQNTPEAKRVAQARERVMYGMDTRGICEPSFYFLLQRHPEIEKEATEAGHPLNRKFLTSKAGIDANQPQHAKNWHVVKAEEGIWCVFYVQ